MLNRIALIGALQNEWGAEHHVVEALRSLGCAVETYDHRKGEAPQACGSDVDLTLVLKGDGIPPEIVRSLPRPTVLWYGELIHAREDQADEVSRQKFTELSVNAASFDFVFHHDYTALETIRSLGVRRPLWLCNSGVNPRVHRTESVPKSIAVGFAGTMSPRRERILRSLRDQGIEVEYRSVFGPELNTFICSCEIFLNMHYSALRNTETRLHEILGAGTFGLSEEVSMPDMYVDGVHLAYWGREDTTDLAEKIRHYLAEVDLRESIAQQGHAMVHSEYTYRRRCEALLHAVSSILGT